MNMRIAIAGVAVACVILVGSLVVATRWNAHQRVVASLHADTVAASGVVAAYAHVSALLEAKRVARNTLLDRLAATSKGARGDGGFPALAPMSERLDDLRRGTHLDDVADTARTALPRADVRDMDRDLTVLLKRQEDDRDAIGATSAMLRSIVANPFAAVALVSSMRTTMDRYTKSEEALKQSFSGLRRDLDRHAQRARNAMVEDRTREEAARKKSFVQAILDP